MGRRDRFPADALVGLHVLVVDDDAEARGFDAHLHKPVDPWELCRVIAALAHKT